MGEVVAKRDTPRQCWARLRLENGDQVMISVAQSGVKVSKMKWAGMIPAATLWESRTIAEVGEKFFDEEKPFQRPLDSIIDKLIDCRSAGEVVVRLSRERTDNHDDDALYEVVERYGATIQGAPKGVVLRDVSELPYPKEVIKSALQHFIKTSKEDKQTLEALKIAYLSLANFQPLTEEERNAVSVMGTLSGFSRDEQFQRASRVAEIYCAALAKCEPEHKAIAKELGPGISADASLEILSKVDAQAIFAMTRDEWTEHVRRAVASGMAKAAGTTESGCSMDMVTQAGLLSVKPDYFDEGKPERIQVTVGYPSPTPKHLSEALSEAALNDAIEAAVQQMKPEYKVIGHVERIVQGTLLCFIIMPGD